MLNPTQVQRSLDEIMLELRKMMEQLLPPNTNWFAEFFTDLLLQIGLVPMQELDADILKNVADKDRLQVRHLVDKRISILRCIVFVSLLIMYLTFCRNCIADLLQKLPRRTRAVKP